MKQIYKYKVQSQESKPETMLTGNDAALVDTYILGIQSFNPNESRLDVEIYDEEDNLLESLRDVSDYKILGVEQGPDKVNQLEVDPTIYVADRSYVGKSLIVEYTAFNNIYARNAELFITDISTDRTEIRAKSLTISDSDLRYYTNALRDRFENQSYFSEVYLETEGQKYPVINAITEVVDGNFLVAFKLYEPLPEQIQKKATFQLLESLGDAARFSVQENIVVFDDPPIAIKGPNFGAEVKTSTVVTPYRNYLQLLSQKSWESSKELYTSFKEASQHVSINYEDFSNFVHFSSAFERLENARYKFELIFDYQHQIEDLDPDKDRAEIEKLEKAIQGIIDNFDHYENYLYFEEGPAAWPKKRDLDGNLIRPYQNVDSPLEYEDWYEELISRAEGYDESNKDILISTIPTAIREDVDNNEPYIMFIHMIGQHFDDIWIYAKAITDRYKADNRPDFGISKELVKDAIETFGLELYETNQNLNALFELIEPDGTLGVGLETYVDDIRQIASGSTEEPMLIEAYTKEVYKRIYHNIPLLVKTKGTSRGLRVLLNCFGIPNEILNFKVQGGTKPDAGPFFGPEDPVDISVTGSVDKIRIAPSDSMPLEYMFLSGSTSGSFLTRSTLSRYTSVTGSSDRRTDDSHKTEIGFDVNAAPNKYFREKASSSFTVDDVIGDPGNLQENYGDPWRYLRESWLEEVYNDGHTFQSPASIIRFVRYFDTTFFRILQDFVPSRASVDSGVIVKDNILHRSRWPGLFLEGRELTLTGSTSGSTVEGSHGGAFNMGSERFDTGDEEIVTTGDAWIIKKIPSGSREFTGELQGTVLQTTDGDLSKYNTHRLDIQPDNRFSYRAWFLDLPDPPLCGLSFKETNQIGLFAVESDNYNATVVVGSTTIGDTQTKKYILGNFAGGRTETHWKDSTAPQLIGGSFLYMGSETKEGSGASGEGSLNPSKNFTFDNVDYSKNRRLATYKATNASNIRTFWAELVNPNGTQGYGPRDLMIAWKYLPFGADPATTRTDAHPWSNPGDVVFGVLQTTGTKRTVVVPEISIFGTTDGYYWVGARDFNINWGNLNSVKFGFDTLKNKTSPFTDGGKIIDATWYGNYEDWSTYLNNHRWTVQVGGQWAVPPPDERWER